MYQSPLGGGYIIEGLYRNSSDFNNNNTYQKTTNTPFKFRERET